MRRSSNLTRFPLQRKIGNTRHYFFIISGIPQFNQGGAFIYKAVDLKNVQTYVKTHNSIGTARVKQMFTDEYVFTENGNITHISTKTPVPQLQFTP